MSWEFDVASSTVGIAAAVVGVALTAYKGIQYQSYLPKKAVNESLESLREQAERVEHQLDQKREQLAQAELTILKVDGMQAELESMRKEAKELQAARVEYGTLTAQVKELRDSKSYLEAQGIEQTRLIEERQRDLQEVTALVETQHRKLLSEAELKEKLAEQDSIQKSVQALNAEIAGLELKRVQFVAENERLNNEIGRMWRNYTEIYKKFEDKAVSLDELEVKRRNASVELKAIEAQIGIQRSQLISAGEYERRLEEQGALSRSLESTRRELGQVEAELAKQEDLLDASTDEHARLNKEIDALDGRRQATMELITGLEKREQDLRSSISELFALSKSINSSVGPAEGNERRLLGNGVLSRDDFSKQRSGDKREEDAVKAALQAIRNEGLIYAERTIWAFHTALKCEAESPLVVLAGLSGTGKSALPRAYARALGMHQLTVAVQPGWDSPSDLLGFYNHLERQFKPTELTRALVQMNPRHEEGDGVRTDLSQRMLLVLLDEMNLARVEYYFSEFLSRLEARRGIKLEDRSRLRDATVPLELGLGSDGATASYPLLVWKNVLFVGTMNEDESTQTLSDKVIDRSNLLRFGKPGKLHGADDTPRDSAGPAVREYLAYETWQRWCQGTGDGSAFDKEINELNDLLEIVHRPFGHRVSTSIRRYISFYPRWTDKAEQWAFADQIEFRILPRLRGLDLADGEVDGLFQYLERLCRDRLDDVALAKAIKQHRDHGDASGQFHWRGLDRTIEEA